MVYLDYTLVTREDAPLLTTVSAFPANVAAAHQQAVLHQGVAVDRISRFAFQDFTWVVSGLKTSYS